MAARRVPVLALVVLLLAGCGGPAAEPEVTATATRAAAGTTPKTWMPSGPKSRAVVWAVGDGADGGAAAKRLAARIVADQPDRLLYLGDVYAREPRDEGDGSVEDFRDSYHSVYGTLAARTAPTPGNHEWPRHTEGYKPYWKRITGEAPPDWYTFRLAGWTFLSLNSEAPHEPGSEQVRWLRDELAAPGTCRIAFWHRPRFSAGEHGDQPDVAPLWDELQGHASLVVNGHDHDSQRFPERDGLVQMVAGAGGHSRYALDDRPDRLAFGDDEREAALRLELRPGELDYAFIDADGARMDEGTLTCSPS